MLQLLQQRLRLAVFEQIDLIVEGGAVAVWIVVVVKQTDKVPALFAPGGEQRVDAIFRQGGQMPFAMLQLPAQQMPVLDDIRPVMAAGILYQHQDLTMAAEGRQCLQSLLRQGADTENHQPARQPRRTLAVAQSGNEGIVNGAAAESGLRFVHVRQYRSPQMCLPALAFRKVIEQRPFIGTPQSILSLFPVRQPVRPVDLISVVQVGQSFRQLVAFAAVGVVGQKMTQRAEAIIVQ